MWERGISDKEVREVLSKPDSIGSKKGTAATFRRVVGGRQLAVVCRELSPEHYLVITIYEEG